ncbi:MAG: PD40 domain-containing protein [Chloroflexi bacterium]|nr:PD40 domain-containing protein [Chloroflexota bacterium]
MRSLVHLAVALVVAVSLLPSAGVRAEEARYFPQTGHFVRGEFLSFFDSRGGLDIFGYPRTEQFFQEGRIVQYFQRHRLEWWPENPAPYRVQLMLIGSVLFGPGQPPIAPEQIPAPDDPNRRYFPEIGHTVSFAFKEFFESRGGLEIFGYPITEPLVENGLSVQYFQRARFEEHPTLSPPYNVSLGLLGDQYVFVKGAVPLANTVPVAEGPAGPPTPASLSGTITFQTSIGGPIYAMKADGTGLAQIGNGLDPAWSPDGSKIAFALWQSPTGIYVMNPDGSDRRLVFEADQARAPAWSPDGSKIAFYQTYQGFRKDRRGNAEVDAFYRIVVVDLADGKTWGPPNQPSHSFSPSWSPDGNTLLFKGNNGLYLVAEDTPAKLLPGTDTRFAFPAWSPDGSRIAYEYNQHDHWEIGVMNADASGQMLLTQSPPFATTKPNNLSPAWSPDGRSIAFISDREGPWKLYVMDADGKNQRPLSPQQLSYNWASERMVSWAR